MSSQARQLFCTNHPRTTTALRCASCGKPICTRCIRESAVGMKCPQCARLPLRARMIGKPRHYATGALAGFSAAVGMGVLLRVLGVGLFGFLMPIAVGYVIGLLVVRAAARQKHPGIQLTAAASTGLGLLSAALITSGSAFASRPMFLFSTLLSAGAAGFAASR